MALYKPLPISWTGHLGEESFLLLALLICALMVTYCWSVLGSKLKLALCFSTGVFLFKVLFDQLIDKRLFPDLHSYIPYVLGSITAGLLEIGASLVSNRTLIIGIFFCGAISPLFCFARTSYFDFASSLVAPLFIVAAAILMFSGLAIHKITHTKPFQLAISAIAGALGIVYCTGWTGGASNWQIFEIVGFRAVVNLIQNNHILSAICLAISGLIVQSLLHLARRQIHQLKLEPTDYHPHSQISVKDVS